MKLIKRPEGGYPHPITHGVTIDRTAEDVAALVWKRTHEKKRLQAYLKGKQYFAHGRQPSVVGFESVMWPVIEKQTTEA